MTPLLEKIVVTLRQDLDTEKRVRDLRSSVTVQAAFAFLLPWILIFALWRFQAEMVHHFFSTIGSVVICFLALAFQTAGGILLWKVSRFR